MIPRPMNPRTLILAFAFVAAVVVILVITQLGITFEERAPECRGTTAIHRRYNQWDDRYETIVVPDDPACMTGGR